MKAEKTKILKMVESKAITATEGMELLEALDEQSSLESSKEPSAKARYLRIRVDGGQNHKKNININIPLPLIKAAGKMFGFSMAFVPEEARKTMQEQGIDLSQMDIEELIKQVDSGLVDGQLVDIDAEDPKEGNIKVKIFVE